MPSESSSSQPDGLEITRKKWAQEKASGEWERAAKRQTLRHREKAKTPASQPAGEDGLSSFEPSTGCRLAFQEASRQQQTNKEEGRRGATRAGKEGYDSR
jgi:hypothetical protein